MLHTGLFTKRKSLTEGYRFSSGSHYELVELLGHGGMGDVWRAKKTSAAGHVQQVALKFVVGSDTASLDDEAMCMCNLSHDNIVPFIDSGRDASGRYFIAMAYVDGVDLDGLMKLTCQARSPEALHACGIRIPDKMVGFIVFMVLRALNYAHCRRFPGNRVGLIHRDISPGNILIDRRDGFVKLSDFGVAALKESVVTGHLTGKIPYMAPEVLMQEPIGCEADIYSLGLVAYELATGLNPHFMGATSDSLLGSISEVMLALDLPLCPPHEVVRGIDPRFSQIVCKMLDKNVRRRYGSASEAMADVGTFLFESGMGPTTDSLSDYLAMLFDDTMVCSESMKHRLAFLDWKKRDPVRPVYHLTASAIQKLRARQNPCRSVDGVIDRCSM